MRILLLAAVCLTYCNADFFYKYTQRYLNHNVRPCDDFFDHVCSAAPPEEHFKKKIRQLTEQVLSKLFSDHCKEISKALQVADQLEPLTFPDDEARRSKINETCSNDLSRCAKIVDYYYGRSADDMTEEEIIEKIFQMTLDYQNSSIVEHKNWRARVSLRLCNGESLFGKRIMPLILAAEERTDIMIRKMKDILIRRFENTKWMQNAGKVEHYQQLVENITKFELVNETYRPLAKKIHTNAEECLGVMLGWHSLDTYNCIAIAVSRTLKEVRISGNDSQFKLYIMALNVNALYNSQRNRIGATALASLASIMGDIAALGTIGFTIGHELSHSVIRDAYTNGVPIGNKACIVKHRESICSFANYTCQMGEVTYREDAPDIMALSIAYDLLKQEESQLGGNPLEFTKEQYLFYTAAGKYCTDKLDHRPGPFGGYDVHSPAKGRMNALMMHSQNFQKAFSCKKGDPMWSEPNDYCHLLGPDADRRKFAV